MRRLLILVPIVLAAVAACSTTASSRNYDPITCQIRNPRAGEPPFDIDCLAAAQASERAGKEAAARDAARAKKPK